MGERAPCYEANEPFLYAFKEWCALVLPVAFDGWIGRSHALAHQMRSLNLIFELPYFTVIVVYPSPITELFRKFPSSKIIVCKYVSSLMHVVQSILFY